MQKKVLTFISDPGHGWVGVPLTELVTLGITDQISSCSYLSREGVVFLEEDCDAGVYINRLKALGVEVEINSRYVESTPIRRMGSYVAPVVIS